MEIAFYQPGKGNMAAREHRIATNRNTATTASEKPMCSKNSISPNRTVNDLAVPDLGQPGDFVAVVNEDRTFRGLID
jgi:hypothetical protein